MLKLIISDTKRTAIYTGISELRPDILAAISNTPRHEFVPKHLQQYAYDNRPLPIAYNQTISQPFIVALMTQLINPHASHTVLEIGTGSGYQAAVLSSLVANVFSIEIIPELAQHAEITLKSLSYNNITIRTGDGNQGWPEQAPFDSIIVTAGGDIPAKLIAQLKPGGIMIIPVYDQYGSQQLTLLEKGNQGVLKKSKVLPVSFVPLVKSDH
ncbi:protein-L-isoaspartate O-methyltransferase [Colwellia psychrerythraea]|uniref:Protein-L-isoaspartate O-methyltransferase n=1 Tax=Colwellia psychrerythraea TaxID=28229 RepID=A0A1Y5EJG4_COLPS|nr:protein-L-isoaspartate O-methyltransferase [Colwellia psychrerythraea]